MTYGRQFLYTDVLSSGCIGEWLLVSSCGWGRLLVSDAR